MPVRTSSHLGIGYRRWTMKKWVYAQHERRCKNQPCPLCHHRELSIEVSFDDCKKARYELTKVTTLNPVIWLVVRTYERQVDLWYSHEVFDDTMELGAFVAVINLCPVFFDPRGQSTEVLYCLGNGLQNVIWLRGVGTS